MSVAAGVLASLVAAAKPKPTPIVPPDTELEARLTTNSTTQRQVIRDLIEQEVLPLKLDLQDSTKFNFAGRLTRLQRAPADVTWTPPTVNALPNATPERMDHKLGRFFDFDIRNAARMVSDYENDPGHSWSFPANRAEAKKQFLELIALKAFYVRTMAAIIASRLASASVADALALYRREGDLVAPMPKSHIEKRLPAFERQFNFHLTPEHHVQLKPTMVNGLWSYPKTAFHTTFGTAATEASEPDTFSAVVATIAIVQWLLIILGFDFLTSQIPANATAAGVLLTYLNLAQTVWLANGKGGTIDDRKNELIDLANNLFLSELNGRLIVVPADPAKMVGHMLGFGLLFMKLAGTKEVQGPFIKPPAALMYLAHHTSDTRHLNDPTMDKFSWVVASAAVALSKLASAPAYCPAAYARVKTLALPELPDIPKGAKIASEEHGTAATAVKDSLMPAEMDELAQFILRAGKLEWGAFQEHRANIAAYARLHAYYEGATAP